MTKNILFLFIILFTACITEPSTESELINKLKSLDKPLKKPEAGEWLFEHKESGQSFADYQKLSPPKPNDSVHTIYIQPIGDFTEGGKKIIQFTAEYVAVFFNLKTIVLNPLSEAVIPTKSRRMNDGIEQFHTHYIVDSLLNHVPKDALITMAVTAKDLYPNPSWNFVFGEADIQKRKSVSSTFRYADAANDSLNTIIVLERLIKTSAHEMGHTFSILHCTHAACVMNGSNHLPEADATPNSLCSECLQKLSGLLSFDNKKRLVQLKTFYKTHHLERDYQTAVAALKLMGAD